MIRRTKHEGPENSVQRLAERLANELLKDHPNNKVVKHCFGQLGLPDRQDPVARLETVVSYLKEQIQADRLALAKERKEKRNEKDL